MKVGQAEVPRSWDQTKVRMRLWWCRKWHIDFIGWKPLEAGAGFCTLCFCLERKWRPSRRFLISGDNSSFPTDQPKNPGRQNYWSDCFWATRRPHPQLLSLTVTASGSEAWLPRCEATPLWVGLFLVRKSFLFSRPIKRWWKPSARFFSHRWSVSGRVTDAFWCYAAYSTVRLLWRPSGGFVCSPPQVWWVSKRGLDSQVDSASPVPQVPPSQQDCWTAARRD